MRPSLPLNPTQQRALVGRREHCILLCPHRKPPAGTGRRTLAQGLIVVLSGRGSSDRRARVTLSLRTRWFSLSPGCSGAPRASARLSPATYLYSMARSREEKLPRARSWVRSRGQRRGDRGGGSWGCGPIIPPLNLTVNQVMWARKKLTLKVLLAGLVIK